MLKQAGYCVLFALSLLASWSIAQAGGLEAPGVVMIEHGKPRAVIVTAADPAGCVPYAVEELRRHIHLITGVELPWQSVTDQLLEQVRNEEPGPTLILIGQSRLTDQLHIHAPDKVDGSRIVIRDGLVAVVGNDDAAFNINYTRLPGSAGTLYGVYELLHRLGVRWYFPGEEGTVLPDADTVRLEACDSIHAPYFVYRFVSYGREMQWLRRIGAGGDREPWTTRHTFETLRFHERFGESHPQWFALNQRGTRTHALAFAHEGVLPAIIETAREHFTRPGPAGRQRYFLVIPADGTYRCYCDDCLAMTDTQRGRHGEMSNYVANAAIAAAKAMKDDFPDSRIVYCAYSNYKLPPDHVDRLPGNMDVLIAEARSQLVSDDAKQQAYQLLRNWQSLRPDAIYFCRYYDTTLGTIPRIFHSLIRDDIQTVRDISEQGPVPVLGEMNFGPSAPDLPAAWWHNLNLYVTARYLWNPDTDLDLLLADYCHHYFGTAAEPMLAFWRLADALHQDPQPRTLWSAQSIANLDALLQEGKQRVEPESIYGQRLARIDRGFEPLRHLRLRLTNYAELHKPDDALLAYIDFDRDQGDAVQDRIGDRVGRVYHGHWTQGRIGNGLSLSGEASGVRLSEPVAVTGAYSIEAWVNPARPLFDGEYSIVDSSGFDRFSFRIDQGRLQLRHHTGSGGWAGGERLWNTPIRDFRPGQWYHLVATFSLQNGMSLYVNGEMIAMDMTKTRPSAFPITTIGARGGAELDRCFPGTIDHVRIYSRELMPAQVRRHYLEDKPEQGK